MAKNGSKKEQNYQITAARTFHIKENKNMNEMITKTQKQKKTKINKNKSRKRRQRHVVIG